MGRVSVFAAGLLTAAAAALPAESTKRADLVYDFAHITPSKELNWVPCFGTRFTCAYLTVPLDYKNQSAGTTDVAFVKYTGLNSTGQEILFNPGGPGGSGVKSLIGWASTFAQTFGQEYDYVGFDPRGVNNTGPSVSCFLTTRERDGYNGGSAGSTPLSEQYQSTKAYGKFCTANNQIARSRAKYVGTSAVVQDMMYYTELVAKGRGEDPDKAKIWYYGVSYGTVVGHTLAAMYPDRIGRILVDGNVYSYEHYQGLVTNAVDNTDRGFKFFFDFCYDAGKACPFYKNDASPADMEKRYRALLQSLEDSPPILPGSVQVIKRYQFEHFAFGKLYSPSNQFEPLAQAAAALEAGNVTSFWPILLGNSADGASLDNGPDRKAVSANANYTAAARGEAMTLISGADVAGRYPINTTADYKEVVEVMQTSSFYGSWTLATMNALMANGLVISPPESQIFPGFEKNTKTATPVLFVGTTGDPITPMSSAHKMSAYFPGSVVLTQNSPGHGFFAMSSACTKKYAREYFKSAKLPPPNTTCEMDLQGKTVFGATGARKRSIDTEEFGPY